jgi:hypothetical protein
MEEIKLKDEEIKRKDEELKKKDDEMKQSVVNFERKVSHLQRNLAEKGKSLLRAEEKAETLVARLTRLTKKKPLQSELEKKLLDTENENDQLKDSQLVTSNKILEQDAKLLLLLDVENENGQLKDAKVAANKKIQEQDDKLSKLEKNLEDQKKSFQKELLDMHTAVKSMRNEKTTN